jgi:hypothetical protein
LLHVVPEGLLLVLPRLFRTYAERSVARPDWQYVQRRFLRLRWHRHDASGRGIFTYEVKGNRKTSQLKGIVVADPTTRFAITLPDPNPHLDRLTGA